MLTSHSRTEFTVSLFLSFLSPTFHISHSASLFILVLLYPPPSPVSCSVPCSILCLLSLHQASCAGLDARLVSVHSPEEYSFLYQQTAVNRFSPAWLGGLYFDVRWLNNTDFLCCTVYFQSLIWGPSSAVTPFLYWAGVSQHIVISRFTLVLHLKTHVSRLITRTYHSTVL